MKKKGKENRLKVPHDDIIQEQIKKASGVNNNKFEPVETEGFNDSDQEFSDEIYNKVLTTQRQREIYIRPRYVIDPKGVSQKDVK